jgi:hypothetical protein
LLLLAKPNAWPAGGCVALLLLSRRRPDRLRALASILAGTGAALLLCQLNHYSFLRVLRAYAGAAHNRGLPLRFDVFADYCPVEGAILKAAIAAAAAFFLAFLARSADEARPYWREYAACGLGAAVSLWMSFTNCELKTSDLMPLLLAMAAVAYRPWSRKGLARSGRFALIPIMAVCLVASGYWAASRLRVRLIGDGAFFENGGGQVVRAGFFAGLRAGPGLVRVLDEMREALQAYPAERVFFGRRIEFGYAAFGRQPRRGLPVYWDPGDQFPLRDDPRVAAAFEAADFELLIFLRNDYTRMPGEVMERIHGEFHEVPAGDELTVYVRNPRPAP